MLTIAGFCIKSFFPILPFHFCNFFLNLPATLLTLIKKTGRAVRFAKISLCLGRNGAAPASWPKRTPNWATTIGTKTAAVGPTITVDETSALSRGGSATSTLGRTRCLTADAIGGLFSFIFKFEFGRFYFFHLGNCLGLRLFRKLSF